MDRMLFSCEHSTNARTTALFFAFCCVCIDTHSVQSSPQSVQQADPHEFDEIKTHARHNGMYWFRFGPAVIESARAIVLHHDDGRYYKTKETDGNFNAVKKWIALNFARKLDFSPKTPIYKNVEIRRWVTLYASEPSADLSSRDSRKLILLSIPIISETAGSSKETTEKKYNELTELMGVKVFSK